MVPAETLAREPAPGTEARQPHDAEGSAWVGATCRSICARIVSHAAAADDPSRKMIVIVSRGHEIIQNGPESGSSYRPVNVHDAGVVRACETRRTLVIWSWCRPT